MAGLSIIIPTYHFACTPLVEDLARLCEASDLGEAYEIMVVDDGSDNPGIDAENQRINSFPHCSYTKQHHNTGKSALLNAAIKRAHYPLILLIDSDAKVCTEHFVLNYLEAATRADVVCGSIATSPEYLTTDNTLRYKYERGADNIRKDSYLRHHPYEHFTTFNVLLHRQIFDRIEFDESLRNYGYEDTVFGLQLRTLGISVIHISNPLIHTGIDKNVNFLRKTETALQNLSNFTQEQQHFVTVSKMALQLKTLRLDGIFRLLHRLCEPFERKNLLGRNPSLFLFKMYKLGYFLKTMASKKSN